MSIPNIFISTGANLIPVDTRTSFKVINLPTVSTNSGLYLLFKDYYGTATNSSISFLTMGTDLIDDYAWFYTLSTNYASIGFLSDGLRSWRVQTLYSGNAVP